MRRIRVPLVEAGLLFLLAFSVLSLPGAAGNLGVRPVYAATTYTVNSSWCSGTGYSWDSGTSTCTLTTSYTLNSGDTLEIPSGTNLTVSGSTTNVYDYGTIYNYGNITINSGTIDACYMVVNYGNIVNGIHGYIGGAIGCSGVIYNHGNIYNYGMINPYTEYDYIAIQSWGTIYNYGYIYNNVIIEFDNFGTIYNYNEGYGIENAGTMLLGNLYNYGYIENDLEAGMTVGTLYNYGSGLVDNFGTFDLRGVIYNYGTFNAINIVDNGGTFYNECGGVIGGYTGYTQLTCYSVTFQQTGIPTSGVTWGVTVVWGGTVVTTGTVCTVGGGCVVGGTDHTGTGASIVIAGFSGTVSYTYDSPVSGTAGTQYVCSTGCSGSVTGATTVSATYLTEYPSTVPQFPAIGPLLLIALLFPALLIVTRRFRKTSV